MRRRQLCSNFPTFYGNRRSITVFRGSLHWSLSWARSIQSIARFILILSTHVVVFLVCLFSSCYTFFITFSRNCFHCYKHVTSNGPESHLGPYVVSAVLSNFTQNWKMTADRTQTPNTKFHEVLFSGTRLLTSRQTTWRGYSLEASLLRRQKSQQIVLNRPSLCHWKQYLLQNWEVKTKLSCWLQDIMTSAISRAFSNEA
jgi:hypothetical protein